MKTARALAHELTHWDGYPHCPRSGGHGPTCDHIKTALTPLVEALTYIASLPCVCSNPDPVTCGCASHLARRTLGG
jgi:hypothetical protein